MQTLWKSVSATIIAVLALVACGTGTPTAGTTSQPTVIAVTATAAAPTTASIATEAPTAVSVATEAPAVETAAPTVAAASTEAPAAVAAPSKLNLNEVTEEQLLSTIPDFSGRMVREFFEYRPYISIQQFRQEIGKYVSAEQVAAYEQYVYVPIAVDEADAATLQQLAGLDATEAETLLAGRPYGSNTAFLAALAPFVSTDELASAGAYLAAE